MNRTRSFEIYWHDLRHAARVLWKRPAFTTATLLLLGLAIGANTAVFTMVNAVLLRPLPYHNPDELIWVASKTDKDALNVPEYEFWKEHCAAFSFATAYRGIQERRLMIGAGQEWITTLVVSTDFLQTLGFKPALGREFNKGEAHAGGPKAIMLSDGFWRRSFGADPEIAGRDVKLDGANYTVVGVLPRDFWFPQPFDALVPMRPNGGIDDLGVNTHMIARLANGMNVKRAQAAMAITTQNYSNAFRGEIPRGYAGLTVTPLHEWFVGNVRLNLLLLFSATGLVLLITFTNLVSLLLAQKIARAKEFAVRLALGSSRGAMLRQFLFENILLALLGSGAGLLCASGMLKILIDRIPITLPASRLIRLDTHTLEFAILMTLITVFLFTLIPFKSLSRINIIGSLKTIGANSGLRTARWNAHRVLVICQIAVSAALLVPAELLIHSAYRMHQDTLGFSPEGLLTFETPLSPECHRTSKDFSRCISSMLERLQPLPGFHSVAATSMLPLTGWNNLPVQREGHPEASIGGMEIRLVTPAYFSTMEITVMRGRSLTSGDTNSSSAVTVVNETLARRWWPHEEPIGDRIVVGRFQGQDFPEIKDSPRTVAGVVADTKASSFREPPRPTIFIPVSQAPDVLVEGMDNIAWAAKVNNLAGAQDEIRHAITGFDSGQRIRHFRPMDEIVASATAVTRFAAELFGGFAAAALVLTAIGIYGLLSLTVAQQRREIGIRIALGAGQTNVLRLFFRRGLVLILAGLALGVGGALLLARSVASLLYLIGVRDPLAFVLVPTILLAAGAVASYLPARRASMIEPIVVLRYH